jgi:hypothetical protein
VSIIIFILLRDQKKEAPPKEFYSSIDLTILDDTTTSQGSDTTTNLEEADAVLRKNIKTIKVKATNDNSEASKKLIIALRKSKVALEKSNSALTGSLSITKNIDKVEFTDDAGFSFLQSSTGAMVPVFYFHKNLLDKIGQKGKTPYLYKSSEKNISPKFKHRGEYFFTIYASKKIQPAPGKSCTILGNAYLDIKGNGFQAWLAYELEENGYMSVDGNITLLHNEETNGTDFAIKIEDWAVIE